MNKNLVIALVVSVGQRNYLIAGFQKNHETNI